MKILFIDFQSIYSGGFGCQGLVGLSREQGHEAYVISGYENINDILSDQPKFEKVLKDFSPDIIGCSVMSPMADYIPKITAIVKQSCTEAAIILGGYYPTIERESSLKDNPDIDYVFIGEAEISFMEFLEIYPDHEKIKHLNGIAYRQNDQFVVNPPAQIIEHIDSIPIFKNDFVYPDYLEPNFFSGNSVMPSPTRCILASRGCLWDCYFCINRKYIPYRKNIRYLSVERLREMLEHYVTEYGIKSFSLLDDTFFMNREWSINVCKMLKEDFPDLKWYVQTRADLLTESNAKLLADSNCMLVVFGLESGCDRIRNEIYKKNTRKDHYLNAVNALKKHGIMSAVTMMFGAPTETAQELQESLDFLRQLDPDFAAGYPTKPYPGSDFHADFKDRIKVRNHNDFNLQDNRDYFRQNELSDYRIAFHHIDMEELQRHYRIFLNEFNIFRRVFSLRYYRHLYRLKIPFCMATYLLGRIRLRGIGFYINLFSKLEGRKPSPDRM